MKLAMQTTIPRSGKFKLTNPVKCLGKELILQGQKMMKKSGSVMKKEVKR